MNIRKRRDARNYRYRRNDEGDDFTFQRAHGIELRPANEQQKGKEEERQACARKGFRHAGDRQPHSMAPRVPRSQASQRGSRNRKWSPDERTTAIDVTKLLTPVCALLLNPGDAV